MSEHPVWVRVCLFGAALVFALGVLIGLTELSMLATGTRTALGISAGIVLATAAFAWWTLCFYVTLRVLKQLFAPSDPTTGEQR